MTISVLSCPWKLKIKKRFNYINLGNKNIFFNQICYPKSYIHPFKLLIFLKFSNRNIKENICREKNRNIFN